jgi:phosphoserine phosphatase
VAKKTVPIKLVFFDMEGTLFRKAVHDVRGNVAPSAWGILAKRLGREGEQEEAKTIDKWNAGQYSGYVEWMEEAIHIHQKFGINKELFDLVMASIEYHPGVEDVFQELRSRGMRTALVSGGFKAQADRALVDLKIDHGFAACEYFWDKKGELVHWNLLPCDYEGKLDFMQLIIHEYGLTTDECAFIGDGRNDIYLAQTVGLSIAFNGAPELQAVTSHSINQNPGEEDFRAILQFL